MLKIVITTTLLVCTSAIFAQEVENKSEKVKNNSQESQKKAVNSTESILIRKEDVVLKAAKKEVSGQEVKENTFPSAE